MNKSIKQFGKEKNAIELTLPFSNKINEHKKSITFKIYDGE